MKTLVKELRGPGTEVLRLLSYASVRMLPGLADQSRRPSRIAIPSTTFHKHAAELQAVDAIERRVIAGPPRQVSYSLGQSGPELCDLIGGWRALLESARLETPAGDLDWEAPQRFARGWAAGVIAALLDGPRSLADIELAVRPNFPLTPNQVEGLLAVLGGHGFIERTNSEAEYALADLGRVAIGELAASARFERRHMSDAVTAPVTAVDAADALRGTLPLIELPDHPGGICEFVIHGDIPDAKGAQVVIAWAEIESGRVTATGQGPSPRPSTTWARGTIDEWMAAVLDHRPRSLTASGEDRLSRAVIRHLHTRLYGAD